MELYWVKSVLTTLALALAVFQGASMAQLRGWIRVLPFPRKALAPAHRVGGALTFLLTLTVLALCLYAVGKGARLYSGRLYLHAVAGGLAATLLFVKVVFANWMRGLLRWGLAVGTGAGVCLGIVFLSSALPYFLGGS